MPAPGDQHHQSGKIFSNPFEDVKSRVSEYTAQEIMTLQRRLEKQLGPEYISSRSGPSGQKVHYLAAEKCIQLANEIFGFNGWSSQIMDIQVDFVDENPNTLKISLGLSVIVRVTLRDGTFHEDIGYGHIENCKGKAAAFEKAKKEGTTDALKRALRNFGNVLGNCIYDKDYLGKVTKIKPQPAKFDPDGLHRHSKQVLTKKESEVTRSGEQSHNRDASTVNDDNMADEFGDYDDADFSVDDPDAHPDEVALPTCSTTLHHFQGAGNGTGSINTEPPPPAAKQMPNGRSQSMGAPVRPLAPHDARNMPTGPPQPQSPLGASVRATTGLPSGMRPPPETVPQARSDNPLHPVSGRVLNQPNRMGPPSAPVSPAHQNLSLDECDPAADGLPPQGVGFFSARAATALTEGTAVSDGQVPSMHTNLPSFNPNAESPSIRKTPGIDHRTSKPLTREGRHTAGSSQAPTPGPSRKNIINPQLDSTRRIGAPGATSPMANRSQYKPPIIKRPMENSSTERTPLIDLPANGTIGPPEGGNAKRQRLNE